MAKKIIIYNVWERSRIRIKRRHTRRVFKKTITELDRLAKAFEETSYTTKQWATAFTLMQAKAGKG